MNLTTKTCAHCGTTRPESEMHQGNVFYRTTSSPDPRTGRVKKVLACKTDWYCKDARCHIGQTLAHEGQASTREEMGS